MGKLLSCSQPISPWLLFYMYYVRASKAKCYKRHRCQALRSIPTKTTTQSNCGSLGKPTHFGNSLNFARTSYQTGQGGRRRILSEESRGSIRFIDEKTVTMLNAPEESKIRIYPFLIWLPPNTPPPPKLRAHPPTIVAENKCRVLSHEAHMPSHPIP